MASQDSRLPGADTRNRRAALFMVVLFALSAGLVFYCARWYLSNSRAQLLHETTQSMDAQANGKAALLTVWAGNLVDQINIFVSQDMMRLFAAEAHNAHIPATELLRLAQEQDKTASAEEELQPQDNPLDDESEEPLAKLAPRLPMMRGLLKDFIDRTGFWDVCLVNTELQVFLTPGAGPIIDANRRGFLEEAVKSGKSVFMPVRRVDDSLVLDLAFPIFAPLYVDASGEQVVAVLLATCNVLPVARAATRHAADESYDTAILQSFGSTLQRIDPSAPEGSVDLPGWKLDGDKLAPGTRNDPARQDGGKSYCLARPVPYLPWLVEQSVSAGQLEALDKALKKNVMLFALLTVSLIGVILSALWWALVGRNERAVAEQMRRLYLVVNQQKQILDGVNSALPAGVVLNDMNGVIFYANQSFATMAGRKVAELRGLQHTELGLDLARSLVTHTRAVHSSGIHADFSETLPVGDQTRYYLASCMPFHDANGKLSGVVSVYNDVTALAVAQQRTQRMVTQTVNAFVRAIEAVDAYLCGQSALTARLAELLAGQLGHGDPETLATLRTAASLSQVGMIRLPRELLTKTGALTADERSLLRKHVDYAREVLAGIDFGLPVLEAITQMYERMDGTGYPKGLKGEDICFNARLLAVANTFCALMRPRSYRAEHSMEDALRILAETPPKYDRSMVRALWELLRTENGKAFIELLRVGK
ncbi:MAG: PAS domain-containing protein [Desulfovibrio sp.]|nr:PAS domain-containing protein [Desulfovibrio sp.]